MIISLIKKYKIIFILGSSIHWLVNSTEFKCEKWCTECNRGKIKIII